MEDPERSSLYFKYKPKRHVKLTVEKLEVVIFGPVLPIFHFTRLEMTIPVDNISVFSSGAHRNHFPQTFHNWKSCFFEISRQKWWWLIVRMGFLLKTTVLRMPAEQHILNPALLCNTCASINTSTVHLGLRSHQSKCLLGWYSYFSYTDRNSEVSPKLVGISQSTIIFYMTSTWGVMTNSNTMTVRPQRHYQPP